MNECSYVYHFYGASLEKSTLKYKWNINKYASKKEHLLENAKNRYQENVFCFLKNVF